MLSSVRKAHPDAILMLGIFPSGLSSRAGRDGLIIATGGDVRDWILMVLLIARSSFSGY